MYQLTDEDGEQLEIEYEKYVEYENNKSLLNFDAVDSKS